MSEAVRELAEELPDHQSSRGAEFRELDVEQREPLAKVLVRARGRAHNDGSGSEYQRRMVEVRGEHFYIAGRLGIDYDEAEVIWWNVVYDDPSPQERRRLV